MALTIGDQQANSGMTQSIYEAIDAQLRPPLEDQGVPPEAIQESQEAWRNLAFAIATGVIEHIVAHMEIQGIQTRGNIGPAVQGNTGTANPANHRHSVNLTGVQNGVVFTQSNDGTGHVI